MTVSFRQALQVWAKIGCLSFGGPAGQIALMHRELVEDKGWLSEKEYLAALNFCMLLPGPEAMQLATYAGWKLHGVKGGLAAGLLFVLPGAAIVLSLSVLYASFGQLPIIAALFYGVKAAVLAIVLEALLRVARRALKSNVDWAVAGLAFLALFCFDLPFPLIIVAAALFGFWRSNPVEPQSPDVLPPTVNLIKTTLLWGAIWLVPLAALALVLGGDHVLTQIGVFFSKLAVVTFGGAYAVLSYMAQAAVVDKNWLQPQQMIDGLGLAETTPGPLILVTEFVAYMAAYGKLGSVWAGVCGAMVSLWMTFAPCFLFIFAGAPYIDAIGQRPKLAGALASITAAVVGVILNLSLWFALHVLFARVERLGTGWFRPWQPDWPSFDAFAAVLGAVASVLLLRWHLGIIRTLMVCAGVGGIWRFL
jgi:chromate transporter